MSNDPFPFYFSIPCFDLLIVLTKSVITWIQIQFLILVFTCRAICSFNLVFLLLNCRCKQPDTLLVRLGVSSPETRPFPPSAQTHNQPAAAPTPSQMPATTRLSKKAVEMTIQTELTTLNILDFYIFILFTFSGNCLSKMPPGCWILWGEVYLKPCIAGTEVSIFSREVFETLQQSFRGCKVLILLPLQSRCQVRDFTSKTKRAC